MTLKEKYLLRKYLGLCLKISSLVKPNNQNVFYGGIFSESNKGESNTAPNQTLASTLWAHRL